MTRIAIHQPNYGPWLGYFAKMMAADAFVFLDNCQMPIGRSYVSRVQVRGRYGAEWMSIPVRRVRGESIDRVRFADLTWPRRHLATLQANYGTCPFFDSVMQILRPIYHEPGTLLSAFNIRLIAAIAAYLGLAPRFYLASNMATETKGTQRLVDIVRCLGGTTYVSGEGGMKYQDPAIFCDYGIELDVRIYRPIRYLQNHEGFVSGLSILDALFKVGPETRRLLLHLQHRSALASSTVGPVESSAT